MRREQISFVEQEPYLIQGSIENNVFLTEHYSRRSLKSVIEKLKFDAIDTMMKEEKSLMVKVNFQVEKDKKLHWYVCLLKLQMFFC